MNDEKKLVTFLIDEKIWDEFKRICFWKDETASQKLRRMIKDEVQKNHHKAD